MDFLVDKNFKAWLIECNTNPSLEVNCSLLSRIIPNMLDNMMNLAVDPYFGVPEKKLMKESYTSFNSAHIILHYYLSEFLADATTLKVTDETDDIVVAMTLVAQRVENNEACHVEFTQALTGRQQLLQFLQPVANKTPAISTICRAPSQTRHRARFVHYLCFITSHLASVAETAYCTDSKKSCSSIRW